MILAEVQLENYKQYVGQHTVRFPEQGVVAVIGANGVGKTTLFEAIEWCLYNPTRIAGKSIAPRAGVGQPRVKVILEDPDTGVRWVVDRRMKRSGEAEVYREDQPEAPVAQGSREVARYVAQQLIGLSHKAFVSTFFTHQKELSFFGGEAAERRREVGRLLGHDTIKLAQDQIGAERKTADAHASMLNRRYEAETQGRDFGEEIDASRVRLAALAAEAQSAETRQAAAGSAVEVAATILSGQRELERRAAELDRELTRIDGERLAAGERQAAAERALADLARAEHDRAVKAAIAAQEPERLAALAAQGAEQERARTDAELRKQIQQAEKRQHDLRTRIAKEVDQVAGGARVPGWIWTATDAADLEAGARRLLATIDALDVDGACDRAAGLLRCRDAVERREQARRTLETYQRRRADLEEERATLLADGDPVVALATARGAHDAAVNDAASAAARAHAARADAARFGRTLGNLRQQQLDEPCPYCARPFTGDDLHVTLAALERQQAAALRDVEGAAHDEREARARDAVATRDIELANERTRRLDDATARIEASTPYLIDAERTYGEAATMAEQLLAEQGLTAEPTADDVAAAGRFAELLEALAARRSVLKRLAEEARDLVAERERSQREVAKLGPVAYDPEAHRLAQAALDAARAAAAQIAQIDRQLCARPEHDRGRAAALEDLAALLTVRQETAARRVLVGFDPAALAQAEIAESDARAAEREARETLAERRQARALAENKLHELEREAERLLALFEEATTRQREADELARMREEFTRFDKYVANLVGPILAERTSEFLAEVTDRKYTRAGFDENYGLQVYDEDEAYPIEAFSGGERDVAALCARLALSTMIGAQAMHPPRFVVLDEVFGSLDQERRAQVLSTLGRLAESSAELRQLFIISHVEDVNFSPVVDEVWRVSEVGGASQVEQDDRRGEFANLTELVAAIE
ncbi:MAG: SMC family ATPase [Thermomicrobiales bacterium]|nr:SMC family ATPase [Thermomicrobiales bacterium]